MNRLVALFLVLMVVLGAQPAQAAVANNTYNVQSYGAVTGDTGDQQAKFAAAFARSGTDTIYVPNGTYRINTNLTVPAGIVMQFEPNALLHITSGHTITFQGPFDPGLRRVFVYDTTNAAQAVFTSARVRYVYPEEFGAKRDGTTDDHDALRCAFASCPSGSYVYLSAGTYLTSTLDNMDGVLRAGPGNLFLNGSNFTYYHGGALETPPNDSRGIINGGTWREGDVIANSLPGTGIWAGYAYFVCTASGSPGTWRAVPLADTSGHLPLALGGTASGTSQGAIDTISQLTTRGDALVHDGTHSTRLPAANAGVTNAKLYGATGDGVTDDTTAVAAAITAANSAGNDLLMPAGTYLVTSLTPGTVHFKGPGVIKVGSNVSYYGGGYATGPPSAGTWRAGDRVQNLDFSLSTAHAWVCTAGGTPGTWFDTNDAAQLVGGTVPLAQLAGITHNELSATAAITNGQLSTIAAAGKVSNSATTATDTNATGAIVARDDSGNFAAGMVTLAGTTTNATDAATKSYVDAVAQGLSVRASVRYATAAALAAGAYVGSPTFTYTETGNGALSVDGATPSVGDRVLVKDQGTGSQDGVFVVTTVGDGSHSFVLTRATDSNTSAGVIDGTFVFVTAGTTNAGNGWVQTAQSPTLDTTSLVYAQFSGAGQIIAGTGLSKSGNTLNNTGVTSVALTMPGVIFNTSVTGSPVTTTGTFAPSLATQTANFILGGPTTGSAATPTFRALVVADLPSGIGYSKLTLTGAILNADLAGSIAYSKLSLTGSILNADLAGSIDGGKISGGTFGAVNGSALTSLTAGNLTGQVGTANGGTGTTTGTAVTVTPGSDNTGVGPMTNAFNCGYTSSAIGDLVYLDSSSTWQKCDATTLLHYNGMLGIALQVKASGAALNVALPGSVIKATAVFPTITPGLVLYMSETSGAITHTAPTTSNSASRVIGWGWDTHTIYFNPSPDYTTHI